MSLYSIIFIVIIFTIILPILLYIKILSWGLNHRTAFIALWSFPFSVITAHFKLYNKYKCENKKQALSLLFLPITKFKLVLAIYAKSAILTEAKYKAIETIIPTLNKKELNKFIGVLNEEGIEVKVRYKRLKRVKTNNKSSVNERIKNKALWENVFTNEFGATIQNELKLCI